MSRAGNDGQDDQDDQDDQFGDLFRATYAPLVRTLAIVHGDRDAAADAVQDAFLQALRHWRRVSRYDDPAAWVRRVALNRLANRRRSRNRREAALRRLHVVVGQQRVEASVTDEVGLLAAIRALPERQRTAVALYYLLDLPTSEVAGQMQVSEATVRSHLHDARLALKERIGAQGAPGAPHE